MRLLPRLALLTLALALAGCAKVPLATMLTLATLDQNTADPAGFGAAVRQPLGLATRPGGVKLTLTITRNGAPRPEIHAFFMVEVREPVEIAKVARYRRASDVLTVYRLSAADAAEMRQLQRSVRSAEGAGSLDIGVSADACARQPLPAGPIPVSTYLKVAASGAYLPVLEDIDLRAEAGEAALAEHVPPCL